MENFVSNSPEETQDIARAFWSRLGPGAVLALHGNLGAGKTCFVQGLALGAEIKGIVSSPTYTLVQEYAGVLPLYHLDLYRLQSENDIWTLGMDDYLYGDGVVAVEWPERMGSLMPEDAWHIHLSGVDENPDLREIKIQQGKS